MSNFAEIDKNGVVLRIIHAEQDFINSGHVGDHWNWVQTSWNNNFRKRFAAVGGTYDKVNDVFIEPRPGDSAEEPWDSWKLDDNFDWQPPIPCPLGEHTWDEENQKWIQIGILHGTGMEGGGPNPADP